MNKIIIKKYDLKTNKINKNIKILLLSDIHISKIFDLKKLSTIIKRIKEEKPNYICIPGDLIDSSNVIDDILLKNETKSFLKEISKNSKVIISLGNHDIAYLNKKRKNKNIKKWKYDKRIDFFNELNKEKNIHILDDDIYTDNNISFIGLTLSFKYYKETNESKESFYEDIENKNIKIDKSKYNVLLCHSPVYVLEDRKILRDVDLILSGHMHNGMVHPIMEKIWKSNSGIISPTKKLYPKAKHARGRVNKENKDLIISGGITKLSYSSPSVFHIFNNLYPMNMEIININK